MRPNFRIFAWLAPVVALTLLTAAYFQARHAGQAMRTMESARVRRDELQRQYQLAAAKLAEQQQRNATATAAAANPAPTSAQAGSDAKESGAASTTMVISGLDVDPRLVVATDPKLRALHLAAFRADLDAQWGPLYQQLHLSADKIEQFKDLLVKHEERRLDVTAVAVEQKLSLGDPAIQRMRSDDGSIRVREMRALLGNEAMKAYNQYNHELVLQPIVAEVAARTYFTATPLTAEESQRLVAILAENSEKRPNNFIRENTVNWSKAIAQAEASGTFSPAALEAFRRFGTQYVLGLEVAKKWDEIGTRQVGIAHVKGVWLPGVTFLKGGY
jgi:hypothetical protein